MTCRHCGAPLALQLIDLGSAPPSNALLSGDDLSAPERVYPLRVLVCEVCWLAQTEDFAGSDELFGADYPYFSGYSRTWLDHVARYVRDVTSRFRLNGDSQVVEIASNDGHLLHLVKQEGIPCFGVEPTASTAAAARAKGIEVVEAFFSSALAAELAAHGTADLVIANNVLAHVPDINDFVAGFPLLMKPDGVATFEFAHLVRLIEGTQFDTIYHEHFSYLSLTTVNRLFEANGLVIFDVEEIPTHGGSLRVFAQRSDTGRRSREARVEQLLRREHLAGVTNQSFYVGFQAQAERVRDDFAGFLRDAARHGSSVAGYGAAAKGNTLLNFSSVGPDLLRFVVDANPAKQGMYLPGSRIPIHPEERLRAERPDFVVILPWNLSAEVMTQVEYIRGWSGRFVTAIPRLTVQA